MNERLSEQMISQDAVQKRHLQSISPTGHSVWDGLGRPKSTHRERREFVVLSAKESNNPGLWLLPHGLGPGTSVQRMTAGLCFLKGRRQGQAITQRAGQRDLPVKLTGTER